VILSSHNNNNNNNNNNILHRFRDIAPHPYSVPILGVFPLEQIADVGVNSSKYVKLCSREIIFDVFQPMWSRYLNVSDRWTARRTDGRTTYCCINVLCVASRGKNINENVLYNTKVKHNSIIEIISNC